MAMRLAPLPCFARAGALSVLFVLAFASVPSFANTAIAKSDLGSVVLLHGFGRTDRAMWRIERRLAQEGFRVHAIGYPSIWSSIDEILDEVDRELALCCADEPRIHFVTHSLGGLVLRAWAARAGSERIGRVVMLGPPNHGSEIIDRLGPMRRALGPTGGDLGTGPDALAARLARDAPVEFELGVIAGNRSWNLLGSWILDGPDDGAVSVESARIDGMRDFVVLPSTHSFMMYAAEVAAQAIHFVEHGRFDRASRAAGGELSAAAGR